MSGPAEKHIETAIQILDERFIALLSVDRLGACVQIVAEALSNAEREGMRRAYEHCAEIAEDHAPGGERYEDYFHENDVAVRIAIRAAILSEANTNSPDTLPVEADQASGAVCSSPAPLAVPYPWQGRGFNPDSTG